MMLGLVVVVLSHLSRRQRLPTPLTLMVRPSRCVWLWRWRGPGLSASPKRVPLDGLNARASGWFPSPLVFQSVVCSDGGLLLMIGWKYLSMAVAVVPSAAAISDPSPCLRNSLRHHFSDPVRGVSGSLPGHVGISGAVLMLRKRQHVLHIVAWPLCLFLHRKRLLWMYLSVTSLVKVIGECPLLITAACKVEK